MNLSRRDLIYTLLLSLLFSFTTNSQVIADTQTPTPTVPVAASTNTPTPSVVAGVATSTPTPPPVPQLGVMPLCPAVTRCREDASCASGGDKLHRVKISGTGINIPGNSPIYFEQCILFDGARYCLPMPLVDAGGGKYNVASNATWEGNNQVYMNAIIQRCRAGFVNATDADAACTETAIRATDGYARLDGVLRRLDYNFHGLFVNNGGTLERVVEQPFAIPAGGYEWEDTTVISPYHEKLFQIIYFTGFGGTTGGGGGSTVHASDLGMPNTQSICGPVAYDPYGKVFNSTSLNPIEGVNVWIFSQKVGADGLPVMDGAYPVFSKYIDTDVAFQNPWKTTPYGDFTFRLPPGTYKLLANSGADNALDALEFSTNPAAGYPGNISGSTIVDANFTGNSVLISRDGKNEILYSNVYESGVTDLAPDILQGNVAIHKNVAVTGVDKTSYVVYHDRNVTQAGFVIVTGRASMPYSEVGAFTAEGRKIKSVISDRDGKFSITIDPNNDYVGGDEYYQPGAYQPTYTRVLAYLPSRVADTLLKVINWTSGKLIRQVQAQQMAPPSPRRLGHVEGFAYSKTGTLLPGAEVSVMDGVRFTVVFKTVSDDTGYFVIPADRLPPGDYSLMYRPAGSDIVQVENQTEFVAKNKSYLDSNQVSLSSPNLSAKAEEYVASNPSLYPEVQKVEMITGSQAAPAQGTDAPQVGNQTSQNGNASGEGQKTSQGSSLNLMLLVYVVILLVLVVGVGVLVAYYMKRKQDPHLYDQQM